MNLYSELHTKDNDFVIENGKAAHHPHLPRMPVFNADETTKLLAFIAPDKRPRLETFNLAPPFNRFFVQSSVPKNYSEFHMATCSQGIDQRGRVYNYSHTERLEDVAMDVHVLDIPNATDDQKALYAGLYGPVAPDFRWVLTCNLYYGTERTPVTPDSLCESNLTIHILLDEDGALIPTTPTGSDAISTCQFLNWDGVYYTMLAQHRNFIDWNDPNLAESAKQMFENTFSEYLPLFFALNCLHSKRTVVVNVPPSRQQKRNAQQKGQQEPPTYKEIKVKGFIKIYKDAMKSRSEGHDYPLHDVIGHFKTYGENGRKKLFNKIAGKFWFEPHSRGNPDMGATDHDYRMTA